MSPKHHSLFIAFILCSAAGFLHAQQPAIDTALARKYFLEVRLACDRDHGKLWGINLAGPILLATPSHVVIANEADGNGVLKSVGSVFVGRLPEEVNLANTAIDWSGKRWSMLIVPLPDDSTQRRVLMVHELWHRVQERLGYPMKDEGNDHLDTREGRIWMQLEWRALAQALQSHGAAQKRALEDALLFRARRREIFLQAYKNENPLELSEGLAEYTGMHIGCSAGGERLQYTLDKLRSAPAAKSFVRSFAYATGPAYGLLCELASASWLKQLKKTRELGAVAQKLYKISLNGSIRSQAEQCAKEYGIDSLTASEVKREEERKQRDSSFRERFIDGPILILPLQEMNMSFDPGTLQPFDTLGTVYPTIRLTDRWGILDVTSGGALINKRFTVAFVIAPTDTGGSHLHGDGWTLALKEGWHVVGNGRKGELVVKLTSDD